MHKPAAVLMICLASLPVAAQADGACKVANAGAGRSVYHSLRELPPQVRAELPGMADVGKPFQSTDVVSPDAPQFGRRMRAAWSVGSTYVIEYQYGGISAGDSRAVISLRNGGVAVCDPKWRPPKK
nr:hypothetical protein [uncultured Gellertiella sp.]